MIGIPEVSLITSWHPGTPQEKNSPLGLRKALEAGLSVFDLYFLNHSDLEWYRRQTGRVEAAPDKDSHENDCPLCFASELTPNEIKNIAQALLKELVSDDYAGRLIGPRPRFTALATYWPLINDDNDERRKQSVRAVQNSLLLARHLGCRHVEIVGGAAFSENDGGEAQTPSDRKAATEAARQHRHERLCESLQDIFSGELGQRLLSQEDGPCLCLEIEPGSAFLINNVESFRLVNQALTDRPEVSRRVLLNVDLAHMFLADAGTAGSLDHAGAGQLKAIRDGRLEGCIGHFHVSDHARTHASDLCPGSYHFFEPDYKPWLELAVELMGQPQFSNTVAVELEACTDIHEVLRAVGRTRSWLRATAAHFGDSDEPGIVEGAILAVDVVSSTEVLAWGGLDLGKGARRINDAISEMCRVIQRRRGSVYSFTGDGVVAIFDQTHFLDARDCAANAQLAANWLFKAMKDALVRRDDWADEEQDQLALRTSLHWGQAVIPSAGPLRYQVLGADVIIGCRLMNATDLVRKPSKPPYISHRMNQAASNAFYSKLGSPPLKAWKAISSQDLKDKFKGVHWTAIRKRVEKVYLRRKGGFKKIRKNP